MKRINVLFYIFLFFSTSSFSGEDSSENDLLEFSRANCLFWYFKEKGYDTEDIKNISSGIVSLSSLSADKFSEVAFLVKDYIAPVRTKNNIDPSLNKCFFMEKDNAFIEKINDVYMSDS